MKREARTLRNAVRSGRCVPRISQGVVGPSTSNGRGARLGGYQHALPRHKRVGVLVQLEPQPNRRGQQGMQQKKPTTTKHWLKKSDCGPQKLMVPAGGCGSEGHGGKECVGEYDEGGVGGCVGWVGGGGGHAGTTLRHAPGPCEPWKRSAAPGQPP
jgi:hypothetical protein